VSRSLAAADVGTGGPSRTRRTACATRRIYRGTRAARAARALGAGGLRFPPGFSSSTRSGRRAGDPHLRGSQGGKAAGGRPAGL